MYVYKDCWIWDIYQMAKFWYRHFDVMRNFSFTLRFSNEMILRDVGWLVGWLSFIAYQLLQVT